MKVSDDRDYTVLVKSLESYNVQMQKAFAGPQPEEEGGEVPEVQPVGYVADLLAQAKVWRWAGIGFGEQETYRLQKSLKKLAAKVQATSLKLFGKINGTERDYYIVEAVVEGEEEAEAEGEEKDADFEPKGTGVNKFTYFVACNSLAEWTKLPDLSPKQIQASRMIKVLFTGDLEKQIYTNPYFDGQEKHYLRA
jgi:radial spoke head protein 4A